jgi:hypothetical protein
MQGIRAKHFLAKPGETSTTFAKTYKTKYYIEFDGRRPKRLVIKRPSASSRNGYLHRADAPRDRTRAALLASVGEGMTDQELAERAGFSRFTVTRTGTARCWSHAPSATSPRVPACASRTAVPMP